ncbi:steroid delta-isomerase [Trebonia kvetii]|uniref:Steroid delta-isomerase n=1 Tax=Trebonia kvetii TaxID=2480626 RepID=A0A6P2BSX5_9ACTN|nr:nuclear transport factor 2 family protein [Trebonia kvetii]TVZ02199.1 steroid delta-isomerase [Trebonia kvetii]
MPSPDQIRAAVLRYLAAVAGGSASEIAACYAPDATVEDPAGSEPHRGRAAIAQFYSPLEAAARETKLLTLRIAGGAAVFHFLVRTKLPDQTVDVEPIDLMTFDSRGLITSMRAFWSESDVRVT